MKILVIEDDHKIARAIKKGLEQDKYTVDTFFDGKSGLGRALSNEYNLIVLDRMLPEVDGINICKIIRQERISIPIIILTARDKINDRVDGLNAGADDYLVKPFAFEELLARVRALLRRPKEIQSEILSLDNLVLDPIGFIVKRQNTIINLSAKEFTLLEYLMRNPGRILTKDMIINSVWNYDANILPNTVEVFIGYLRQKIDRAFPNQTQLIKTVRGFGYKIG